MTNIFIFSNNKKFAQKIYDLIYKKFSKNVFIFDENVDSFVIDLLNQNMPQVIIGNKTTRDCLAKLFFYDYLSLDISIENLEIIDKINMQLERLFSDFKYIHKIKIHNIKKFYWNCLLSNNFSPNMLGTHYILDCIICLYENPYSQATQNIFSKYIKNIALKYNTNVKAVLWNIRKSINYMCQYSDSQSLIRMFGSDYYIPYQVVINSLYKLI